MTATYTIRELGKICEIDTDEMISLLTRERAPETILTSARKGNFTQVANWCGNNAIHFKILYAYFSESFTRRAKQ